MTSPSLSPVQSFTWSPRSVPCTRRSGACVRLLLEHRAGAQWRERCTTHRDDAEGRGSLEHRHDISYRDDVQGRGSAQNQVALATAAGAGILFSRTCRPAHLLAQYRGGLPLSRTSPRFWEGGSRCPFGGRLEWLGDVASINGWGT